MLRLNNLFVFILSIIFITNSFAQTTNEWTVLASPTNDILRKLFFVDANNGWATGLAGTIIHTSNGGDSWVLQNSTVTTPIVDIFFVNTNLGFAVTYPQTPPFGTTILKTTTGGSNWFKDSTFFENEIMSTVFFFDELEGFLGGNGIKKTTDGGATWFNTSIDSGTVSTLPVNNFSFYSNSFGYACGGRLDVAGVVWRTTDGGNNWSSIGLSADQIFDVFIFDSLNAITLSGDPEGFYGIGLIKTTDAGLNWSFTELPYFGLSFAIDFLNNQEGWSASGYKFLHTTDGGDTWFEEPTPDSTTIYDLQFVDEHTGFACGQDGALLKYVSPVNVEELSAIEPIDNLTLQNYPNPFNSSTIIRYSISNVGKGLRPVSLIIYNILGKEMTRLVDDEIPSGNYELVFNVSSVDQKISSGIYLLSLKVGQNSLSKKIIYLK